MTTIILDRRNLLLKIIIQYSIYLKFLLLIVITIALLSRAINYPRALALTDINILHKIAV